jgi:RNA polymerase sigma-70 factor (ECF subfamily)
MQAVYQQFGGFPEALRLWRLPGQYKPYARPMRSDLTPTEPRADFSGLIEAIAARQDRNAFAALFDHFAPRIKSFLMRSGMPSGPAEELAQDALLMVWRKAAQFDRARAGAAAWIYTIARNLRIDSIRHERRSVPVDDPSEAPDLPPQPDCAILAQEREQRVRAAMKTLSNEQVEVVRLSFFEGKAHGDIAQTLGLPLGTVKSRLRLAMKRLRELLVEPS